jgi:hypothetical protein
MLEIIERAIKNGHPRETGNITKPIQMHNTMGDGHHYTQTNTNNVNKTLALLQTTGGKDKPNIIFMWKS